MHGPLNVGCQKLTGCIFTIYSGIYIWLWADRNITGQWRMSHRISSRLCIRTKYTSGFLCIKNKTPETEPVYQSPFLEVDKYKLKPFVALHHVDW